MPGLGGLHHASLSVSDLDASISWYREVLGLEVVFSEEGDGRRAAVLRFADGGYAVGLTQHEADGADARGRFDPRRIGLDHLAFTVPARAQLDEWAERLTTLGIEHSGAVDIPPGAILNLKDPDGIALALFWDRPAHEAE